MKKKFEVGLMIVALILGSIYYTPKKEFMHPIIVFILVALSFMAGCMLNSNPYAPLPSIQRTHTQP